MAKSRTDLQSGNRRVLGAEHPDTLTSINNLSVTYKLQGQWKEAEELDLQVVETRMRMKPLDRIIPPLANWKCSGSSPSLLNLDWVLLAQFKVVPSVLQP